jgi:hypothetical protein
MMAAVGCGRRKKKFVEVGEKKNSGCSRHEGGEATVTGLA